MSTSITVPLWLALVVGALAAWALLDRLLMPSARWFIRSRANRVLDEVGRRLKIHIRPFQQVRRQALIDRLIFDDKVQQAAQAFADRAQHAARGGAGPGAALRARDRAGVQRLRVLPRRLLDRQERCRARCTACASATPTTPG